MEKKTETPPLRLARKLMLRKYAEEKGLCLVEGWKCILEAGRVSLPETVFMTEDCREAPEGQEPVFPPERVFRVSGADLKKLCDTRTPEGIVAIFQRGRILDAPPPAGPGELHLFLYRWQDPANVGSAVRSARGLGVKSVSLWGDCPDFFSQKVIRSSMGSVFHSELCRLPEAAALPRDWNLLFGTMEGREARRGALCADRPNALVMGSESSGLPEEWRCKAGAVSIPLSGGLESLSAPVAAAVLMDRLLGTG